MLFLVTLAKFIMSESTTTRGRLLTGKAMTSAEKQKAYRDRQRALIKQLKPKIPKIALITAEQTIKHYEIYKEKLEEALKNVNELLGDIRALKIKNSKLKLIK